MNLPRRQDADLAFVGLHCPACGYELTGLPVPRCPECGEEFDPAELSEFQKSPPKTYLGHSIAVTLVCWPIGLPALYYSIRCRRALRVHDLTLANKFSHRTVMFGFMGLILLFFLVALLICGSIVLSAFM